MSNEYNIYNNKCVIYILGGGALGFGKYYKN